MKKLTALFLCVVMAMALASCGQSASPATAAPSAAAPATQAPATKAPEAPAPATEAPTQEAPAAPEPVEIVWAGWSGEEDASKAIFQSMRDTFGQATGNTVSWIGWPWADTAQQLLIRTDGGETLDIAQVDISIYNTVEQAGVLADLNEVLGADYLKANFEEAALAIGNRNGKQTAMPWSMASLTMVYNPQILSAAGWSSPPTTIADFEKCLADIAAYDPETIPYAVSTKDATAAGDFAPWLWTFGGSIFNADGSVAINSDAGVATVEWYQKLLAANYIRMDIGRFEARQMFAQGKVAFYDDAVVAKGTAVSNGVDPSAVAEVCSAIPRPVLNAGDQPQSTMWGHMLVIFDKSKVKDQAAEFAKHLVSEEIAMNYFNNNGMPPTLKSVVSSSAVQNDAYVKGFLEATKTARLEETATLATGGEIKTIITEELQAALLGSKTAKQAVDDMAARINSL